MATGGDRIGRVSMVDEVSDRLRELLLSGEIQPGQRLRLRELEDRFGVSHIPIREALRRLESEGLVDNQPQRGAVATSLSVEQLTEIYDARRLLEPPIAERAVERVTEEDEREILEVLEQLEAAEQEQEFDAFYTAHRTFHWLILRPGAGELLERILNQLWQDAERFVRLSVTSFQPTVERAHHQHREMLEHVRDRDAAAVRAVVEDHLHLTEDAILGWYEGDGASGS